MSEYRKEGATDSSSLQSFQQAIRAVAGVLGIVATVMGLVFAVRVFMEGYAVLHAPEKFQAHLERWTAAVGGKDLDLTVAGASFHAANLVAVVALGCGGVLLTWLSLGLMVTGAKIVYWAMSDREAVKRILVHAFGRAGKPNAGPGGGSA